MFLYSIPKSNKTHRLPVAAFPLGCQYNVPTYSLDLLSTVIHTEPFLFPHGNPHKQSAFVQRCSLILSLRFTGAQQYLLSRLIGIRSSRPIYNFSNATYSTLQAINFGRFCTAAYPHIRSVKRSHIPIKTPFYAHTGNVDNFFGLLLKRVCGITLYGPLESL